MANGDGAAIGIHVRRVIGNAEIAEDSEGLRSESFVELDDVHLRKLKACLREDFARSGRRAHAHDTRSDASSGSRNNASFGREAMALGRCFRSQEQGACAVVYARSI